jgi:hypothetical protein
LILVAHGDHKEIDWEDSIWIRLVQDGVQWLAFVNTQQASEFHKTEGMLLAAERLFASQKLRSI